MIIVTGATGFVGRYLIDHLVKAGEKVVAAGRTRKYDEFFRSLGVPFVPLDVTQPESFNALPTRASEGIHPSRGGHPCRR
jgi:UDP-glucose 4-epimerase